MNTAGLFSGIGGLEVGFEEYGLKTEFLCEYWEPAQQVLGAHFPSADLHGDIASVKALPGRVGVITAGFPCTDLSQAGRTAGIKGKESGLVSHVFRLLRTTRTDWVVLENVKNMLSLDKGEALRFLTNELETMGFSWAYRTVDSRFTGVPQRRHRVLLVASKEHDPREVLFADNAPEPSEQSFGTGSYGFYWTEGLTGLGWAHESTPPLKGGSGVGIPSAPAIWIPTAKTGAKFVTPSIDDAEAMQGFQRGWTWPAHVNRSNGPRWKLIGNAVTTGVSHWLAKNIASPAEAQLDYTKLRKTDKWPKAAWGAKGERWSVDASLWPMAKPFQPLSDLVDYKRAKVLSLRATSGFRSRTLRSKLRFHPEFLSDLDEHIAFMSESKAADKQEIA